MAWRSLVAAGILVLLACASGGGTGARADAPASTDQRALSIERTLACPQCTDLPLDVCDQDICNDMRAVIQQKVRAGESDSAIRGYFVQRYGARVLLSPEKSSSGLLAWLLPFAALIVGAALTVLYFRFGRRSAEAVVSISSVTHYRRLVEEDLREIE